MAHFYVVQAKRVLFLISLLVVLIFTATYVFQEPSKVSQGQLNSEEQQDTSEVLEEEVAAGSTDNDIVEVFFSQTERNVSELDSTSEIVSVRPVPTTFSEYRLERERVRSRQTGLLESIVEDENASEDRREKAKAELMMVIELMTKETEIESLLKAKGFTDGVVMINGDSVTVVVPTKIDRSDASQIGELINRITGVRLDRITIVDEMTG